MAAYPLPAAGWRSHTTGALYFVGTNGHYWSSTPVDGGHAQSLWFSSGPVFVGWNWRSNGLSVRCVAE